MRALILVAVLLAAPVARAQVDEPLDGEGPRPQTPREGSPPAASTSAPDDPANADDVEPQYSEPLLTSRRAIPSYDGRAPAPTTFGQKLLWIPRVLFFPVYVAWEYLLRVPLAAAVPALEKANVVQLLFDFFTWEDRKAGLVPTFFFNFGFLPSAGVYFFWNDFLTEGNHLRVWGGFWGTQYLHAAVSDRVDVGARSEIEVNFDYLRRPDQVYGGEGYDVRVGTMRSRYKLDLWQAHLRFQHRFWRESMLRLAVGLQHYRFSDTTWGDEPSVPEAVDQGLFSTPAAFVDGYTKVYQSMRLAIDNRRPRPASATGVRLQVYGELGYDVEHLVSRRWFRYGATGGAWFDFGSQRRLGLGGGALFADPVGDAPLPFNELIRIEDFPNLITGYYQGDLRGRSAAGLSLVYRYPIWVWLEGVANVAVANVFGEHLGDFDVDRLRLTWGMGISTIAERDTSFTLEIAFGTDTFAQGAHVSSFRLSVGASEL